MLFNPDWSVKPKADPLSLEGLIAWLETMPADGVYYWPGNRECLACRYLQSLGHEAPWGDFAYASIFGGVSNYRQVAASLPWTFGAALSRARALAAEGKR
jgi:hypothetical protein